MRRNAARSFRGQASQERVIDQVRPEYYSFMDWYYGERSGDQCHGERAGHSAQARARSRGDSAWRPCACGRKAGVIIEAEAAVKSAEAYMNILKDLSRRQPIRGLTTEDIMRMTRGEDSF